MRVLLVGFGSIARKHLTNIALLYPQAQVAVWCRPGFVRSSQGLSALFHSAAEAIAWQPDFVIIASPASHHLTHVTELASLQVPILLEKPLATDCVQGRQLLAQLSAPARLGYQLRYTEGFSALQQWFPTLGRLYFARLEVGQYLPAWRPDTAVSKMVSARPDLGGGALLELSHELDLLTALLGLPERVYAATGPVSHLNLSVEESVELTLLYAQGTVVQVHLDMLRYHPCRHSTWLGEQGQIDWNMLTNHIALYDRNGQQQAAQQGSLSAQQVAQRQLVAFFEGENGGAWCQDGLLSLAIVDAARRSLCSRQEEWVHGG